MLPVLVITLTSCHSKNNPQADTNQRLLNASFNGTAVVVEELLQTGADPNYVGFAKPYHPAKDPLSPIEIASANASFNTESFAIVQALLKHGAKPTVKALVLALDGTENNVVSTLVKAGVNVNEKAQVDGRELLPIIACVSGTMSSSSSSNQNLATLLAAGVSLHVVDSAGRTPLLIAAANYTVTGSLIDPLIAHGANLKAKGKDGKTALDLLRAEATRCHTAPNYHAGMCDSTDAELARLANSPAH